MQQTRKPGPQRALVLAGGGAKGSYQVGVWQALQELGWTPDIITGASVGALNGCLFTMGKSKEAEDLWRRLEIHDVLEVPDSLKPEELNNFFLDVVRSGGLNVEPLAETIDRLIDEDAVRRSPIRFGLVMTELGTMRRVQCPVEKIPEGQMKDYLLGSSACFPALRPREIDGVKYIDGGWRDNMPLDLAAAMGAGELLAVDVNGVGITRPSTTGLPTRIIRSHWNLGPTLDFAPERAARSPAIDLVEKTARQLANYPAPFAPNPSAPTAAALAPLELAAEHLNVPADMPYTPKLLAATVMGSFEKDPADRFPALLDGKDGSLVAEKAMAAAAPEEFVTALVSRTLADVPLF